MTLGKRDYSIWESRTRYQVVVGTLGPDGTEDRFTVTVSRAIYGLARAAKLHAEKHGCDADEVLTREISFTVLPSETT